MTRYEHSKKYRASETINIKKNKKRGKETPEDQSATSFRSALLGKKT